MPCVQAVSELQVGKTCGCSQAADLDCPAGSTGQQCEGWEACPVRLTPWGHAAGPAGHGHR